jgi:hypothetical protein
MYNYGFSALFNGIFLKNLKALDNICTCFKEGVQIIVEPLLKLISYSRRQLYFKFIGVLLSVFTKFLSDSVIRNRCQAWSVFAKIKGSSSRSRVYTHFHLFLQLKSKLI